MRAAAKVEPVALRVDFQGLIGGNRTDQLDLVHLALLLEEALGLYLRLQTRLVNGLSRAMISRMRFSIAGKSSGVKGALRKKS